MLEVGNYFLTFKLAKAYNISIKILNKKNYNKLFLQFF